MTGSMIGIGAESIDVLGAKFMDVLVHRHNTILIQTYHAQHERANKRLHTVTRECRFKYSIGRQAYPRESHEVHAIGRAGVASTVREASRVRRAQAVWCGGLLLLWCYLLDVLYPECCNKVVG